MQKKLLDRNAAYVCICNPETFKDLLLKKEACPCRNLTTKEQSERWKGMLDKKGYKQGQAVLRFKSDLNNNNPAMRDFPLARINTTSHPLQKKKYRVWPLMNLAVATDDIEQNMTHIIRGKDHKDNAKRQEMIYKALGKSSSYPWVGFIGRINLKGLNLSSSKIKEAIKAGKYKGWSDPKLPTIASLKKRGYNQETFWKYAKARGISEVDKTISEKDFYEVLDNFKNK